MEVQNAERTVVALQPSHSPCRQQPDVQFLAPASQITPNGFATVVGTVLLGTWNTVHAWFPHLAERGQAAPDGAGAGGSDSLGGR